MIPLDYELRQVPPPMYTIVYGRHWLVTVGDPPVILAVCRDRSVAERICGLLAAEDRRDVEALITTTQGERP